MATQKGKKSTKTANLSQRHARLWKILIGVAAVIILLVVAAKVAFMVSPWPNALLIRYVFEQNDTKTSQALEKYLPNDVTQVQNQHYKTDDRDAYLDVFYPQATTKPLSTVIWVHGGAWVAGSKDAIDNYMSILAAKGYTTVSIGYTLAPEKQYPTPIVQLNEALGYLQQNADRLHIDQNHLFLAGDSAGSQIVAQMANIITSPSYAKLVGIQPTLPASKLHGMLLNCGAYDLALVDFNSQFGGLLHTVLWAYSGTQDFLNDPKLRPASVANYVTPQFPPSFITAGNADPLEPQSKEFAQKLQNLGVMTSTLFYPANHQPQLPHEYQFNLDQADGKLALQQMLDFLQTH